MSAIVGSLELALASQHKGRSEGIITKVVFQGSTLLSKGMNRWWRDSKHNGSNSGSSEQLLSNVNRAYRPFTLIEGLLIGEGGRSKVYKGFLDGGTLVVAIKRLKKDYFLADKFKTEIEVQPLLCHRNIVLLIGFCKEKEEFILVYEYMINGSLKDHLNGTNNVAPPLSWKKRLEICIDVARGLQYLHTGAKHKIIKGTIMSSNILLDENCGAKLRDFSRMVPSTGGVETWGYSNSEYMLFGQSETLKTDVLSFGFFLFEVLSPKDFIAIHVRRESVHVDPYLIGKMAPECFTEFVNIALRCTNYRTETLMGDVVDSLQSVLQLQEDWQKLREKGVKTLDPTTTTIPR